MTKMHENELEINESLVYKLLKTQCPQWAKLPLESIASSGTDNALFRLGNDYVVRLPRIEWEPGSNTKNINKEYEWIPKIARMVQIPISEPLFKGNPDILYPWSWTITKWNEGHNPSFEHENEYNQLAIDLACFLNELHGMKLINGPSSRRGIPLAKLEEETRQAISQLEGEMDIQAATLLWDKLSTIRYWDKEPVWVHGDLLPGNILVHDNRLTAVIDFADVGMGDPACDLIIGWSLFNSHSRRQFRDHLTNIDDETWERGRGWALSIALILLPYYMHSNPVLTTLARRMIANVLTSE